MPAPPAPDSLTLGIETSCDETSVAVVRGARTILSNVVSSQITLHRQFGGVVPDLASRAHLERIVPLVDEALGGARCALSDLGGVAVTVRPGLIGSLLIGLTAAKSIAWARKLPLAGVSHLEAHLYAAEMEHAGIPRPYVALLVSGGHTILYRCEEPQRWREAGGTIDDAAGETFDKVAALLGLPYPGGPAVERTAREGDPRAHDFPRSWLPGTDDFSFSGLKTAVRYATVGMAADRPPPRGPALADVCASFQEAVVEVLAGKTCRLAERVGARAVTLTGGVAANGPLRDRLRAHCEAHGWGFFVPSPALCTDNAAMVAGLGAVRLALGERDGWDLDAAPRRG